MAAAVRRLSREDPGSATCVEHTMAPRDFRGITELRWPLSKQSRYELALIQLRGALR
jgi:hypothetical protein